MPVDTGVSIRGLSLQLTYDTAKQKAAVAASLSPKDFGDAPSFGGLWMSSLHRRLAIGVGEFGINAHRGDGHIVSFAYTNGAYTTDADAIDQLKAVTGGYQLTAGSSKSIETYNTVGQLTSITTAQGNTLSFSYSDASTPATTAPAPGYLLTVTDNTGRSIRYEYTFPAGATSFNDAHISKVIDPAGQTITPAYDSSGNLTSLTWPDTKTKSFLYENAALPWALTGVIDENTSRYATIGYDAAGNAISSELAGGVDKYVTSYSTPPQAQRTQFVQPSTGFTQETSSWSPPVAPSFSKPNGSTSSIGSTSVQGMTLLTSMSQPAGAGCAASTSAQTYDANANITSHDDFSGNRTCYAYDAKNQEVTRVEGLATSVACTTVLPANATLPSNARKTSTSYHPDWRLATVTTAPGSITTNIYQGQADPFNANQVANCTPAANMPNGKPLPLLCKQVIQATLPSGALDTTVANTTTSYSYDAAGRILTSTDSLNRTTNYSYYSNTAFTGTDPNAIGHTIGDLQSITNPAGHITTFNSYDKSGRILQTTDPKGVVTAMSYTPRGWISSVTTTAPGQTARTTNYSYDNVGQLTGVTNPDGSTLAYSYDAAHRLIGATDAKGNSISYTLDNMGNRIKEDIKDPSGTLQRSINRSFDALNRLQQVSGVGQ
jgi:YD repeat-containing protein